MSPRDLDLALRRNPDQLLTDLLALDEDQWFERKSGRVQAKDLAVPLVAFANAEGGVIVVGLSAGAADGVAPPRVNDLRQAAMDHTTPPVRVHVEEVEVRGRSGPVTLLVMTVQPGEHVHETTSGECYLRVGDESRRLTFAQRQELHYDRGTPPYDGTPAPAVPATAWQRQAEVYAHAIGSTSVDAMLRARSLLTANGSLTVAGYLLFADEPQELLPQAFVRILRYRDTERGAGTELSLDSEGDVRCTGSIPHMILQATAAIERLIPRRRSLAASGRFEDQPVVPRDAWLEGLVNAVLHRSYSMAGDHIRVEIFPDRVEIESPGRFPGLVDPEKPWEIARYARNPRIARVCTDLRISQGLGEGVRRIFAEMRASGLTDPLYRQTSGSVRLTLSAASAIPADVLADLPRGAEQLLSLLRRAGHPLGTGEIADTAGIARPTVLRQLNALRDRGIVEWNGKSPKDPRATWRVR